MWSKGFGGQGYKNHERLWRGSTGTGDRCEVTSRPLLQAFLLCDEFYVDERTKKPIIVGVFTRLILEKAPARRGRKTYVYASLTDVAGSFSLVFRWLDLASDRVLYETLPISVANEDRLVPVELLVELPGLPVEQFGPHALELLFENELVHTYRVNVEQMH